MLAADSQNFERSSLNRRVIAAAIDLLILLIIITPVMNILSGIILDKDIAVMLRELGVDNHGTTIDAQIIIDKLSQERFFQKYFTLQFITFLFMSVYVLGSWIYKSNTIGKWICACKIVDSNTLQPMRFSQCFSRWFGYIISALPLGIGFIMIGFAKNKKGLHDKVASTTVINFKHDFSYFNRIISRFFR